MEDSSSQFMGRQKRALLPFFRIITCIALLDIK